MDDWSPIAVYEVVRVMRRERAQWYETTATLHGVMPERRRPRTMLAGIAAWLLQLGRGA